MADGSAAPFGWRAAVCPSEHAAAAVRHGCPGLPTYVCRPGVSRRGPLPLPAAGVLELVTVANFYPDKGHLDLVAALASLRTTAFRWTLVGSEAVDPAHARAVRQAVDSAGLAPRTRWLGAVAPGAVADVVAGCHLLVHPSRRENYGMVLAEALALGRPVVACAVGGVPEVVQTNVTGLLVEPGSAPALAAALARVLDEPSLLAHLHRGCVEAAPFIPTWHEAARDLALALDALEGRPEDSPPTPREAAE
jgi:glycosyltransferase involved in cell wall biosynthesis